MGSHHFIGTGHLSPWLERQARDSAELISGIKDVIESCGLTVADDISVAFANGGSTIVWVLAESHLVLHVWALEGYATVDLHVCDYRETNADKAQRLVDELTRRFFAPGSDSWHSLDIEHPAPVATPV